MNTLKSINLHDWQVQNMHFVVLQPQIPKIPHSNQTLKLGQQHAVQMASFILPHQVYEARISYLGSFPLHVKLEISCDLNAGLASPGRHLLDIEKIHFKRDESKLPCDKPYLFITAVYAGLMAPSAGQPKLTVDVMVIVEPIYLGLTPVLWKIVGMTLVITGLVLLIARPWLLKAALKLKM